MSGRWRGWLVVGLGVLVAAACDSGPQGPGVLSIRLEGSPTVGAVILEIAGPGIRAFEGQGDTRAYGGALPGRPGSYRVVLVDPTGGTLDVGVLVDDLGAEDPVVTVVGAAGTDNGPRDPGGITTRILR